MKYGIERRWDNTVDAVEDFPEDASRWAGEKVGGVERFGDRMDNAYDQGRDEERYDDRYGGDDGGDDGGRGGDDGGW